MALIGTYYLVEPDKWLMATHGDVREAKRRADQWFEAKGTYEGAEQEIEEFVRQWALKQLIEVYHYPIEWLGEKIQIEEPVKMGSTEKEADIAIKNNNRRAFLFVETKKGNISDVEFEDAQRQLETYLAATHTATIGIHMSAYKRCCSCCSQGVRQSNLLYWI